MKIEILYPEIANLYGQTGDVDYLKLMFPDATFYYTQILEKPYFLETEVDFVMLGPMSEQSQLLVIEKLLPFREDIHAKIKAGQAMLVIANAMEIFGQYIENDKGEKAEALGLFPYYAKQQMLKRLTDIFLGEKDGLQIVGSKAQFTQVFSTGDFPAFCRVVKGLGLHEGSDTEGIHYKNFIGTYNLGPFLLTNPLFSEQWFKQLFPEQNMIMPFHDLAVEAYKKRVEHLLDPKAKA